MVFKKIKNPEPIVVNGVSIIPDDAFDIVSDDETGMIKGWGGYIKVNIWGMPIK